MKGRKRHLCVDSLGLVVACHVHPANEHEVWGAVKLLDVLAGRLPRARLIRADGGYDGGLSGWVNRVLGLKMEIVRRDPEVKGFVVVKGRWVVERTFGWLGRSRRLSKDYEQEPASSRAMVLWAMTHLMLRRLKPLF